MWMINQFNAPTLQSRLSWAIDRQNYLRLRVGWKFANLVRALSTNIHQPNQRRPRLLILVNTRGWAFDDLAQQRVKYMASTWDVDIQYIDEEPHIDPSQYDLMFDPNWGWSGYDALFTGRYVRGINSHKWERGPRPYEQLRTCLRGAVACFVPNEAQVRRIRPAFPATFLVREGIDPAVFYWIRDRSEPDLVVGWTGNQGNRMKRLETVIKPACARANVELHIAKVPSREELNRFYNDVDVVLIGSEPLYEGNPLSLFEAGACGRTVIATNVGAVPEVVEDGVSGFIIEATNDIPYTIQAFVERLNWCKEHVEEVRRMGKRHQERVLRDRTPDKTCEQFRQAIEWAYGQLSCNSNCRSGFK